MRPFRNAKAVRVAFALGNHVLRHSSKPIEAGAQIMSYSVNAAVIVTPIHHVCRVVKQYHLGYDASPKSQCHRSRGSFMAKFVLF